MKASYQCLKNQEYTIEDFSLVPIRWEDRYKIMQWRNEQMFHLRQDKRLTASVQDAYFENTISKLFGQKQPKQILFSLLKEEKCIGYGGLVHIDWKQRTAEISFLMDTELEKIQFSNLWSLYLSMIEKIAFRHLNLNEIYTYSYEVRPQLYTVLDKAGYIEKERISDAIQIQNTSVDALIHVKKNVNISYRLVEPSDSQLLFDWVNETSNRINSINSKKITKKEHNVWFRKKITDSKTKMYMFFQEKPVGVLRLDEINNQLQISFSVEKKQRGKGIGNQMIVFALSKFSKSEFVAQVIESNTGSHKIFLKNNFVLDHISGSENEKVMHYIKKAPHENN